MKRKYTRKTREKGKYSDIRFAEINATNVKMIDATVEFLNRGKIESIEDEKAVQYAQNMFLCLMRQATAIEG